MEKLEDEINEQRPSPIWEHMDVFQEPLLDLSAIRDPRGTGNRFQSQESLFNLGISTMFVCPGCIEDAALGELVRMHLDSNECSYCGATSNNPIAADLDEVLEFMDEKIGEEYDDANNLPHDSEDGFLGKVLEPSELFDEISFYVENEELLEDITTHFSG